MWILILLKLCKPPNQFILQLLNLVDSACLPKQALLLELGRVEFKIQAEREQRKRHSLDLAALQVRQVNPLKVKFRGREGGLQFELVAGLGLLEGLLDQLGVDAVLGEVLGLGQVQGPVLYEL